MGIFRKRPVHVEPELGKLLDGYSATTQPHATPTSLRSLRCWKCKKPTMFDVRRSRPSRCSWCNAQL